LPLLKFQPSYITMHGPQNVKDIGVLPERTA